MFGTRRGRVLEAFECSFNVAGHGDIHGACGIVPFEVEATVKATCPVGGERI